MATDLKKILETHQRVVEDGFVLAGRPRYRSYAISTLRGGVGKSTLAFNIAFELAQHRSLLIADVCPQRNLTETLLGDYPTPVTVLRALQPMLLGPAFGEVPDDLSFRVSQYCPPFKEGKPAYFIPGDAEMFAFPSALYQQLQIANAQAKPQAMRALLESLKTILDREATARSAEGILMDTSPFYAGGTHLAWCAADAIIIPVRVDEHSVESLELTLDLLSNPKKDFRLWNDRAGGLKTPRVAAIVMTMVGSRSRIRSTPDRASNVYIERAMALAEEHHELFHHELFDHDDPIDAFVITDDFVSSGRVPAQDRAPRPRVGRPCALHTDVAGDQVGGHQPERVRHPTDVIHPGRADPAVLDLREPAHRNVRHTRQNALRQPARDPRLLDRPADRALHYSRSCASQCGKCCVSRTDASWNAASVRSAPNSCSSVCTAAMSASGVNQRAGSEQNRATASGVNATPSIGTSADGCGVSTRPTSPYAHRHVSAPKLSHVSSPGPSSRPRLSSTARRAAAK